MVSASSRTEHRRQYLRDWYRKNRERVKELAANRAEDIRRYQAAYRAANKQRALENSRKWHAANPGKNRIYKRTYRLKNREELNKRNVAYYAKNREKRREWYRRNAPRILEERKEYHKRKAPLIYARRRQRYKTCPMFKIRKTLANRIVAALKSPKTPRSLRTLELLGCDMDFFRDYLSARFSRGMSWDNHGSGPGMWHIDHRIPCAGFNLLDPEEQKRCFHYTNLQPMWQNENLSKNAKMPAPHQAELI